MGLLAFIAVTEARAQSSAVPHSVVLKSGAEAETPAPPLTKRAIRRTLLPGGAPVTPPSDSVRSTVLLALGGAGGWAFGAVVGVRLGHLLLGPDPYFPTGTIVGALSGMALGMPLGVHLMNRLQGNYLHAALASTFISLGGTALSVASLNYGIPVGLPIGLLATAVAQGAASIVIERATAR